MSKQRTADISEDFFFTENEWDRAGGAMFAKRPDDRDLSLLFVQKASNEALPAFDIPSPLGVEEVKSSKTEPYSESDHSRNVGWGAPSAPGDDI